MNWPTVGETRGLAAFGPLMPFQFAAAIMLMVGLQTPEPDRRRAEDLARAGRSVEAIELFTHIVETNPADVEASRRSRSVQSTGITRSDSPSRYRLSTSESRVCQGDCSARNRII